MKIRVHHKPKATGLEIIKCWYEKATDLYLITPVWWDRKRNARYLAGRDLTPCKMPILTAKTSALIWEIIDRHSIIWLERRQG